MTDRPDVAALAAALAEVFPVTKDDGTLKPPEESAGWAKAIIAALAAQGWRITSAPEGSNEASSPASGEAKSEVVTADDPVSAQAAPDYCGRPAKDGRCVLPVGHNMGKADVPANHSAQGVSDPDAVLDTLPIVRARVRAALEGLRADLWTNDDLMKHPAILTWLMRRIDARLAALG